MLIGGIETLRFISNRFDLSIASLNRHRNSGHITKKIVAANERKESSEAKSLLNWTDSLIEKSDNLTDDAIKDIDRKTAFLGIGKTKELIELKGKLTGELREKHEITGADGAPLEKTIIILPSNERDTKKQK
jgi:hypothetical protein